MRSDTNWPMGVDYSHPNHTLKTPRTSRCTGGYAPDSQKIPFVAWIGAAAVVAVFFGLAYVGFGAGF